VFISFNGGGWRGVKFLSADRVRSADSCCSATKASAPKELVGESAVGLSWVTSSDARSRLCEICSAVKERPFVVNVLCPGWQLLTVDKDDKRECVADCKDEVEERLLRLEKVLCPDGFSFRFWISNRESSQ
jgi:hypothetical protein